MVYDNSQVSTYQMCPLKYKYKYVDGLQKYRADDTNIDLIFGQKVHKFLELMYKKENPIPADVFRDMPVVVEELVKTPEGGIRLCTDYLEAYTEQDKHLNVLGVEDLIEFEIGGLPFAVKLDTVVEVNGNIFSLEHKTTKRLQYNYFHQFHVNSQMSAQTYAVKQKYGKCAGVIVNALEIKYLKRGSKINPQGFNTNFERDIINRTQEEVDFWKKNVEGWIKAIEHDKKMDTFLACDNGYNCSSYRGCTFKDICRTAGDQQIIETMYDTCDPFAYLKEDV